MYVGMAGVWSVVVDSEQLGRHSIKVFDKVQIRTLTNLGRFWQI